MSLEECFEKVEPETWAKIFELDTLLYWPQSDDPAIVDPNYYWAKRLFAIKCNEISFDSLFEEYIKNGKIGKAAQVLEHISESNRRKLTKRLHESITVLTGDCAARLSKIRKKTTLLSSKNLPQEARLWLSEIIERLDGLEKINYPRKLSASEIGLYEEVYIRKADQLDEDMASLEALITSNEHDQLKSSIGQIQKMIDKFQNLLLSSPPEEKEVIERCFLGLPVLALSGRIDDLREIDKAIGTRDIEGLKRIRIPKVFARESLSFPQLDEYRGKVETGGHKEIISEFALRDITNTYYIRYITPLEIQLGSETSFRSFLENQVNKAGTPKEASDWLLRGAKTISSILGKSAPDLLARGLLELGQHLLEGRRYTHAFAVFSDAFRLFVGLHTGDAMVSRNEIYSATGMLLSDWIPRAMGRHQNIDLIDLIRTVFANPSLLLERIASGEDIEVTFHSFDEIAEVPCTQAFVDYLVDWCPKVEWASVFLDRMLRPRSFLMDWRRKLSQLRALLRIDEAPRTMGEILDQLQLILDDQALGRRIQPKELAALESLLSEAQHATDTTRVPLNLTKAFTEGIEEIVRFLKEKQQIVNETVFTIRPVNSVFYLEERCEGLELIVNINVQEMSLPISSLVLEAAIDDSQSKLSQFITLQDVRVDLGFVEPDTIKEAVFVLDIDRRILLEYSEIGFRFNCFDGIKEIKPLDKKQTYQFSLRTQRKGSRLNPYIDGKAIEKGGLYVGREKELQAIKGVLIGQSQDNVPLVVGIRRIGKTSLLKRLIDDEDIKAKYIPILFDLEDLHQSATTVDFLRKLAQKIHKECGEKWKARFSREEFVDDPFEAFFQYISSFSSAPGTRRVLVIFDECEKLIANIDYWTGIFKAKGTTPTPQTALLPESLGAIRKAMLHANRISFIICGLPTIKLSLHEYEARWFGLMSQVVIKPLDRDEAKLLIQPLGKVPYKVAPEAVEEIIYMTGCQPFLIQKVCSRLFVDMLASGRETAAKEDVTRIIERDILPEQEYLYAYRKLIGEDGYILKAIAVAHRRLGRRRRFIPLETILDYIGRTGYNVSRSELSSRLTDMERAERPLVERSQTSSDAYRIVIGALSLSIEEDIL